MGRRKIEIQPIHDDRNRTVTFIKRKAGLFKKAHELAVLCQVDVAVIILGSNNTFYEFSSVDVPELLTYYNRQDLVHDTKQPADFGNYVKKSKISLHDRRRKRPREEEKAEGEGEEGEEEEPEGSSGVAAASTGAPQQPPEKKKHEEASPQFNPLQQHVQRQFQSLYAQKEREPPQRPVLRVEIPNDASCGGAIQSESSTPTCQQANPGLVSRTTSSVRRGAPGGGAVPLGSSPRLPPGRVAAGAGAAGGNVVGSGSGSGPGSGPGPGPGPGPGGLAQPAAAHRRRELPPMFSGSPALSHYLATPLQQRPGRAGVGLGLLPGTPGGTGPGAGAGQGPGVAANLPPGPGPPGAPSGAAELIPSPAISSVFPDWRTNLPSAAHVPQGPESASYGGGGGYTSYNGSTGLTPYIVVNNTPLGNRFFNFERRGEEREDET